MSSSLQWMIVRDNNCFLMKRKNAPTFTKEPNNLRGINSYRYSGLVRKKTLGIEPASDGKGVVLITKRKLVRKPVKGYKRVELKKHSRKTLKSIRATIKHGKYRKDLKTAALRKASAILKSQKPKVVKKLRSDKKKD